MAQGIVRVAPTSISLGSPGDGAWNTISLTTPLGGAAGGAVGVILYIQFNAAGTDFGLAHGDATPNSSSAGWGEAPPVGAYTFPVGINSSDEFKIFADTFADITAVYLIGYIPTGAGAFYASNEDGVIHVGGGTTTDTLSVDTTTLGFGSGTVGAVFGVALNEGATTREFGIKPETSSETTYHADQPGNTAVGVCALVDANEQVTFYHENTAGNQSLYVYGVLYASHVTLVDPPQDYSTGTPGSWVLTQISSGHITEASNGAFYRFGKTGASTASAGALTPEYSTSPTFNIYGAPGSDIDAHMFTWCGFDTVTARGFAQKIETTNVDLFLWGYVVDGAVGATPKGVFGLALDGPMRRVVY